MTNLLPPEGQKRVRAAYRGRVAAVWAFLIALVMCTLSILLLPTYELFRSQLAALALADAVEAEELAGVEEAEAAVRAANTLAQELAEGRVSMPLKSVIAALGIIQTSKIQIRSYQMERSGVELPAVTISGIASSREALVEFQRALEAHAYFERAEVPLGDLVLERDLPFTITVTLKTATAL